MATGSVRVLPESRTAGLALMAGVVLTLLASLLYPGGVLVDAVDPIDFPGTIVVMFDNASLTHMTTLAMTLGILLEPYGLLALFRVTSRQGSFADAVLRFGVIASLFGWLLFIFESGTRHMAVHVMQHGVGAGTGPEAQAQLREIALAVFSAGVAAHFAFLAISSVAAIMLGLGLAARCRAMNVFKAATYGMVLVGVMGLINLVIAQHIHDLDFALLALVSNGVLTIGAVCLFVFRAGMCQGRSEFVPEDS